MHSKRRLIREIADTLFPAYAAFWIGWLFGAYIRWFGQFDGLPLTPMLILLAPVYYMLPRDSNVFVPISLILSFLLTSLHVWLVALLLAKTLPERRARMCGWSITFLIILYSIFLMYSSSSFRSVDEVILARPILANLFMPVLTIGQMSNWLGSVWWGQIEGGIASGLLLYSAFVYMLFRMRAGRIEDGSGKESPSLKAP